MKKYLLLSLIVSLVIIQKINAQTPVTWYLFNGNASEAIASLNETVIGANVITDRFGNANNSYSFDGLNKGNISYK